MSASDVVVCDADDMSLKDKERLTAVAKAMTEDLLAATDLLGGVPWALVHEKHGISLFRADVANDVPCNVHAVYKFNSDIEDAAASMITSTTDSYKSMMRMLSSDFIDGAVVQTIVEPTELNPHRHVALKWAAFKSSSRFSKDRDFIILEYVDMIEDDQGQKIAFRIMESVDVPNNSPYAESPKYTRDVVPLMGFMYHTTKKPGELRLTYSCNFDKNGNLPAWAANSAIQQHVEKCIMGIVKYIEAFRADKEEIVLPQQVIPMSEQDHCHVCQKNFCVLRRKYNCLKCGEVICSNCSSLRMAIVPDVGVRQLRVCTACVIAVRRSSKTPAPQEGGLLLGGSPHALRAPSATTADSDVSSVRSGSSNGSNASLCRTQSFSHGKRRSLDDVLDPVRSRLIEYKTFSDGAEIVMIPKASPPQRSFSDGIIKKTLFSAKRRGSPADLAISLEAFRQHQTRMGNNPDHQNDDGDACSASASSSDSDEEDAMEELQRFSPLSATSTSSASSSASREQDVPAPRQRSGGHGRVKTFPVNPDEFSKARARFNEARDRAPELIEATKVTNDLAQRMCRKVSQPRVHHRVAAIQLEEQVNLTPLTVGTDDIDCDVGIIPPAARVRRAVCQTKNGTVLYGRSRAMERSMDQHIAVVSRGIADLAPSNQCVDAGYRRQVFTSERSAREANARYHQ